jgi:hypothetical protein
MISDEFGFCPAVGQNNGGAPQASPSLALKAGTVFSEGPSRPAAALVRRRPWIRPIFSNMTGLAGFDPATRTHPRRRQLADQRASLSHQIRQ